MIKPKKPALKVNPLPPQFNDNLAGRKYMMYNFTFVTHVLHILNKIIEGSPMC